MREGVDAADLGKHLVLSETHLHKSRLCVVPYTGAGRDGALAGEDGEDVWNQACVWPTRQSSL